MDNLFGIVEHLTMQKQNLDKNTNKPLVLGTEINFKIPIKKQPTITSSGGKTN